MTIGAISANSLLFLNPQSKARDLSDPSFALNTNTTANSAESLAVLPSRSAIQLSFENVIALQSLIEKKPAQLTEMSATEKFLAEARKTPMERMREQILEELGLSEEALAQMSPEDRRIAEDRIRQMIEEKIRQAMNGDDAPAESNAAMIEQLA